MPYASLAQARDAGATGTDVEVTAAISEATARVDRYTGDVFEPRTLTMTTQVGRDGVALLRRRVATVTAVRWWGSDTTLPVDAYRVTSSAIIGERDAVILAGSRGWADVTVLGAEPWNGGWLGLAGRQRKITVDGTFGWSTVPPEVAYATALVAADIRAADYTPAPSPDSSGTTVDAEGNVLPVVPPFTSDDETHVTDSVPVRSRTTGNAEADALLASFVREPVRLRVS